MTMPLPTPVRHLYIHVPFCARRCSYCDFAIAVRAQTPVDEYVTALATELAMERGHDTRAFAKRNDAEHKHMAREPMHASTSSVPWELDTVYLGGGTPSRLGGGGIGHVLALVRQYATIAPDAEITLEANPDDITSVLAAHWREAGINRISLGVQSFHDTVLQWMHRTHTAQQASIAVDTLRAAGIDNISVDLIFAVPPSLHRDWPADVDRVLALAPSHISLYGLTVEPHTPLGKWRQRGTIDEASEEVYEADFLHAHRALMAASFEHYEVSNYGRPGLHARHNSAYWRAVPYAALGPSAHRFDGTTRSWNVPQYADWVQRLQLGHSVVQDREHLTPANRAAERVYLGLRVESGLAATDAECAVARPWVDAGWAHINDGTIVLTALGWLRLDALAAALTAIERP